MNKVDKTNMPDEVLDLVDEKDEVIGEVRKGVANNDPSQIHREIEVVLYNDKNEVLIQQRSFKKKVHPGMWALGCAGHVPKGMSPVDAAHMELKEELGFDVKLRYVEKRLDRIPTEARFVYTFVGEYDGSDFALEEEEVEQVGWLSEEDFDEFIRENKMTEGSKTTMRRFWKETWSKGA